MNYLSDPPEPCGLCENRPRLAGQRECAFCASPNKCPAGHQCACGHARSEHTRTGAECADGIGGAAQCECFGFDCAADIGPDEDCCCDECQRGDYA